MSTVRFLPFTVAVLHHRLFILAWKMLGFWAGHRNSEMRAALASE
ncbi:unnamed protein product [Camellia sinensis]